MSNSMLSKFSGAAPLVVSLGCMFAGGFLLGARTGIKAADSSSKYYVGTLTPPLSQAGGAQPDLVVIPADSQEHAAWMVHTKLQAIEESPRGNFYNQTIVMLKRDPKTGTMEPVDNLNYATALEKAKNLYSARKSLGK